MIVKCSLLFTVRAVIAYVNHKKVCRYFDDRLVCDIIVCNSVFHGGEEADGQHVGFYESAREITVVAAVHRLHCTLYFGKCTKQQ